MPDVTCCYICKDEIIGKGEKDHFPRSKSLGGTLTLPICISCHTQKDRYGFDGSWNPEVTWSALMGLWGKASTLERLVLAKFFHVANQGLATLNKQTSMIDGLQKDANFWAKQCIEHAKELDAIEGVEDWSCPR